MLHIIHALADWTDRIAIRLPLGGIGVWIDTKTGSIKGSCEDRIWNKRFRAMGYTMPMTREQRSEAWIRYHNR